MSVDLFFTASDPVSKRALVGRCRATGYEVDVFTDEDGWYVAVYDVADAVDLHELAGLITTGLPDVHFDGWERTIPIGDVPWP